MNVAIIGKGIIGLSLGRQLMDQGHSVSFFFASPAGASLAALGSFVSKGIFLGDVSLFSRKLEGQARFLSQAKALSAESGEPVPFFKGAEEFFQDEAEYRFLRKRIYRNQFTGAMDVETRKSAFYYPQDYWVDCQRFLEETEAHLRRIGACWIPEAVIGLEERGAGGLGVLTGTTTRSYSHVVLAAGGLSPAFLRQVGIDEGICSPRPGYTVLYRWDRASQEGPSFHIKRGRQTAVFYKNTLRMGPFIEAQAEEEAELWRWVRERRLGFFLGEPAERRVFSGVRGRTPSGVPYLGRMELPKGENALWVSFGYDKSGFSLALWASETLAHRMAHNEGGFALP